MGEDVEESQELAVDATRTGSHLLFREVGRSPKPTPIRQERTDHLPIYNHRTGPPSRTGLPQTKHIKFTSTCILFMRGLITGGRPASAPLYGNPLSPKQPLCPSAHAFAYMLIGLGSCEPDAEDSSAP